MGCACNQRGKIQYEVAMEAGRGRSAFKSASKPTAITVSGRYDGSAVRIQGTNEIVFHKETYEVAEDGGKGIVVFAHSDLGQALEHAGTVAGAVVRERETGDLIQPVPATDLGKAEAPA
jgi:hypothetical protein